MSHQETTHEIRDQLLHSTGARPIGVSDEMRHLMIAPHREVKFGLPLVCHEGGLKIFRGYRVPHKQP